MAEAYEPPDDAHRRFVQRQRAPEESPVAFRGTVLELAMAAYPVTEPDLLEPLILGKMLELSKDLGIPMPICGHEQLTSRMAAKCLDVQFNLRRWAQVTTWMGSPTVVGGATGWTLSKAVFVLDERGPGDLSAAAAQWVPRGGAEPHSGPPLRDRRDGEGGVGRRADSSCYHCGRLGLSGSPSPASSAGVPGQGRDVNARESTVSGKLERIRHPARPVISCITVDSGTSATIISDVIFHRLSIPPSRQPEAAVAAATVTGGRLRDGDLLLHGGISDVSRSIHDERFVRDERRPSDDASRPANRGAGAFTYVPRLISRFHYSRDVTWHRGSGTGELQGPRLDGELHPIALISIQQWTDHGDGDVTEGRHHRTAWAHRGVMG
ncbi:unnamed protein product [Lampetra planeri]